MLLFLDFMEYLLNTFVDVWEWLATPFVVIPEINIFSLHIPSLSVVPMWALTFSGLATLLVIKVIGSILDAVPVA